MLTITTTHEDGETTRTIRDEQGNVVAKVWHQDWLEAILDCSDEILTERLERAGYTWEDVE